MTPFPILIDGAWRPARATATFQAENPRTREPIAGAYPVSSWADASDALEAATRASRALVRLPGDRLAAFLERYAARIEDRRAELVDAAVLETGLPAAPRLGDVELPRTTNQLRQAAAAARDGSWCAATIDTATGIRSYHAPLGPICVFGPNNFPFAFGSISGGDFAAAIAAGNPVIAKAHASHPATTRIFAEEAAHAAADTEMPSGTVQLLYRLDHADGERLVSDPRCGATAYTGSRSAGLRLKAAADSAGRPIYLELSSINPVVVLEGAIRQRCDELAAEFSASCLMAAGQFCTNPGLVVVVRSDASDRLIAAVAEKFQGAKPGTLLSRGVQKSLEASIAQLVAAGAEPRAGNTPGGGDGYSFANTLLSVPASRFLAQPETFQTEAFGNESLWVVADDVAEVGRVVDALEGNLTGCIYSDPGGADDDAYEEIASRLRRKVGRLLNDKMPTGVAVSSAMNHGGPYPATGHPGFTAVGIPASLVRFSMLQCFDNVRPHRLPGALGDKNPTGTMWRRIDGRWSTDDVA